MTKNTEIIGLFMLLSREVLIMESREIIKISVRNLIQYVMQSGDIESGFTGSSRMVDAIKAHQIIQKSMGEEYQSEIPVSFSFEEEKFTLEISGRIDGIFNTKDSVIIDEIKTVTVNINDIDENYNPLHFAQAKCYAYIYGKEKGLQEIGVQLTYYQMNTKEIKHIIKNYSLEELKQFFDGLIGSYLEWAHVIKGWEGQRNSSIKLLNFPFSSYRDGQRRFAVAVYRTIMKEGKLFAQAPTGIGKTMAALFPAVKAVGEGKASKIFYLTSKTIARTVAEKAFDDMKNKGLRFKTLTLTAKEKICFSPGKECKREECKYAMGYYDRVKDAIKDIFSIDSFSHQSIEAYARKYSICPFEFSLDLSLWSDCIICDYNYVFDPKVYLKRFFLEGGSDYCFLIDEAHNLVDRSREMFSAELFKKPILELKRNAKSKNEAIAKSMKNINDYMIKLRKKCEEGKADYVVEKVSPNELIPLLRKFIKAADDYLSRGKDSIFYKQVLDLYFNIHSFVRIYEYYDERYITYIEKLGNDVKIKLFCLDPSQVLQETLKRGRSAVFFSATLTPIDFFLQSLGGDKASFKLKLASPFPDKNLCVLVDNKISTKLKSREHTYERVAESIYSVASEKNGNYLAYFPSYKYMNSVYEKFIEINPDSNTVCQKAGMSELEREQFIEMFSSGNDSILVGFAVMGGIFGEGIDLVGDRLSGAVIVGVGLPQICLERDIIKKYYQEINSYGFEYAYIYPGMNRVMQAVGRVIRSEVDRGVVLLMDDRFTNSVYKKLLPGEWKTQIISTSDSIKRIINGFWHQKENK